MKQLTVFFALSLLFSCGAGNAPEEAAKFAAKHYPGHTSVECIDGLNADSDDDSYVSCTIFHPDGPIAVECATAYYGCLSNSGCRMATGKGGKGASGR